MNYYGMSLELSRQDINFLGMALSLLAAFIGLSELIRRYLLWTGEVTRKIVHIGTGLLIFFACYYLESGAPLVIIGVFFTAFNFLCVRFNWFAGMHSIDRPTYGTVYYPLAFTALTAVGWEGYRYAIAGAMLILAIGDALAALVGQKIKIRHVYFLTADRKTLEGSLAMLFSSWLSVGFTFAFFDVKIAGGFSPVLITFIIAVIATVVEAVSSRGYDNLTLPLAAAWLIYRTGTGSSAEIEQLTLGFLLASAAALTSYRLQFLSVSGSAGAFLLGVVVFGVGGWAWTLPILVFFIASSVLSKIGQERKSSVQLVFEKGSVRDFGQVVANGALPGLVVILAGFFPDDGWFMIYCGMIAAVSSDTWSTEIGTLFRGKPRNILNFQKVEVGTSGGVSWIGLLGGFFGAGMIAVSGWMARPEWQTSNPGWVIPLMVTLAGLAGSLFDSLLGATMQSQYRCRSCGMITEKKIHCNSESLLVRGWGFFHNDRVNQLCALMGGALIAAIIRLKNIY